MEMQLGDVSHIIQLAIAPVFLLTGVGTILMVLTNRLARIIDRARRLEDRFQGTEEHEHMHFYSELDTLSRRAHLINRAITLATASVLLVCIVIAALFMGDALGLQLGPFIAALFVLAMITLISSLIYLLGEVFVATRTLSFRSSRVRIKKR
jgi:UDP-N-acetylmuramyl pentapeptide phosphotransferase/UDP-N-acetylglucosamine-1-phosphate transferase